MNVFRVRLLDGDGRDHTLGMSTIGPHYGPGGQSGFAIMGTGVIAQTGPQGDHLRTDGETQEIRFRFDPREGLFFYYDGAGEPTVAMPGVPALGPIEAIEFVTTEAATWVMEDLVVESTAFGEKP